MSTIHSQLSKLRKLINLPWEIRFVDKEVYKDEFEENVIYIHITI